MLILVHLDPEMRDGADGALPQELADVPDGGALDVVVPEDSHLAATAGGLGYALGVGERRRHWLLAPDMLALFERGDRHWRVPGVGSGDRDDVDGRVGDE